MSNELAALEQELGELRRMVEAADKVAAERRRHGRSRAVQTSGIGDVQPIRDRIQVLEARIARLRKRTR